MSKSEEVLKKFEATQQRAKMENNMEAYKDFVSELAEATIYDKQIREQHKYEHGSIISGDKNYNNYTPQRDILKENFSKGYNDNIYNTYDYTNVIITDENIKTLIKYIFDVTNYFEECARVDEDKNKSIKYKFRNYLLKKNLIQSNITITINNHDYRFNNHYMFLDFCNTNKLKNVSYIYIYSTINFSVGMTEGLLNYDNKINIAIRPYKINLTRKSNIHYKYIDKYESDLKKMFSNLQKIDSIF